MSTQPIARPSIWPAAHAADDARPRSRQTRLGASDTVCGRRAAYIVHGVPKTDAHERRAAILGTYLHAGFLGDVRTQYGWQIERVVEDDDVLGHVDVVQFDEETAARLPRPMRPSVPADVTTIEDVKTKSPKLWDRVVAYGATEAELRQVYTYGGILSAVGFADVEGQRLLHRLGPIKVGKIRFRFINRDDGAEHIQEFAYDPDRAMEVRWWIERVRESKAPEDVPREHDGPGLSAICDHCPFVSRCWAGAAPGRAPQSVLIHDDEDRAQYLAEYHQVARQASEAKNRQKFLRKVLDGSEAGEYDGHRLAWKGGKSVLEPDEEALIDIYEDAELVVPMRPDVPRMVAAMQLAGRAVPEKPSGARTPVQISVTAVPKQL